MGLQTAIPSDYGRLAMNMGFDKNKFIKNMQVEEYKELALADFAEASRLNIQSYPAVLLRNKGVYKELTRGYRNWKELENILNEELKQ